METTSKQPTGPGAPAAPEVAAPRPPLVSVGIPVYNGERYLGEAVGSILAQTFEDLEVIISDNASTDRTEEIARAWASQDRRVRYHRSDLNLGAAKNYRRVFDLARGEYFKWAASDDVCGPRFVESCLEALRADARVVLAYPKTLLIDDAGKVQSEYEDRLHIPDERPSERLWHLFERLELCNAQYGLLPSRVISQTRPMGTYSGADVALLAELALRGKFIEVPERLFFRRFHAACSSLNRGEQAMVEFYDPKKKGRPGLPILKHHLDCSRRALRVPMSVRERLRVAWILAKRAYWARKLLFRDVVAGLRGPRKGAS